MNRLLSYRAQTSRTDVAGERASIEQGIGRAEINRRALATDHLLAELGHRTRRGGVIAIGAQLARLAIQFVTLAILARLLLPADFGIIAMAATITGFVVMFSELGLSAATVQRQDIDQDTVSGLFLINAAMGVAVMVAVIALAPVAAWFFEDDRVRTVVIAMALPIPLLAASRQHAALLQRGMRWISLEIATIVAQAIAALVAIAIAWQTDLGYWALVAQSWAAGGLTFALLWLACPWRPSRVRDWSQIRSALGFGLHLTGFQFLNFFHRQFDDVLVGRRWGAVELGYYNRAYLLLLLPLQLINGPVGSVIVPALSRIKDDHRAWARLYRGALQTTIFFTAPMAGLLTLMSPQIVHLALGPEWGESSRIFQILAISILFQPVMSSTGWLWVSAGATRTMLKWAAFSIPLMVLGMIIGLPYGAVGVAAGYAVSIALLTPLCTYYASRGLPIGFLSIYRAIAVPIVAAVIAFAATRWAMAAFGEGTLGMIERVGMFGAIYLLLTYLGEAAIFTRVIEIMKSLGDIASHESITRTMNDTPRKYPVDIRILRIGFGIVSAVLSIVYALLLNPVNRLRHRGRSERKLEIGPGFKPIKGFEAVNIVWTPGVDYVYDTARKMPFASGSFDLIYASHVLEHIPWYLVPSVLKEWQRILKPGGTIEIWVPDGLRIARAFVDAEDGRTHSIAEDGWYKFNADRDPAAWACGRIFSYGDGKGKTGHFNWHLGLFSERYLKKLLTEAGFADCRTMDRSEVRASDHGWINLGVAGAKSA